MGQARSTLSDTGGWRQRMTSGDGRKPANYSTQNEQISQGKGESMLSDRQVERREKLLQKAAGKRERMRLQISQWWQTGAGRDLNPSSDIDNVAWKSLLASTWSFPGKQCIPSIQARWTGEWIEAECEFCFTVTLEVSWSKPEQNQAPILPFTHWAHIQYSWFLQSNCLFSFFFLCLVTAMCAHSINISLRETESEWEVAAAPATGQLDSFSSSTR